MKIYTVIDQMEDREQDLLLGNFSSLEKAKLFVYSQGFIINGYESDSPIKYWSYGMDGSECILIIYETELNVSIDYER